MKISALRVSTALFLALGVLSAAPSFADTGPALTQTARTDLKGYEGDFDHFAVDMAGNRLFLAAEDHGTLEVFDLKTGAHEKTVKETIDTPHSIFLVPGTNRMILTDSGDSMTKILDATTLKVTGSIKLHPAADSIGYDTQGKHLYIVTGGKDAKMAESYLEEIDPATGEHIGEIKFDSDHTEAMAIEQNGPRLFISVTAKGYTAVIDKKSNKVIAQWPVKEAEVNAPLALDEAHHRLFVVTRKPGMLVVVNTDNGQTVASFKAPERCDEVVFDKANQRVYVAGGDGHVGVFSETDPDHFVEQPSIPSAVAAKTAILIPDLNKLYLAVSPGEAKTEGAGIIQYTVNPAK